MYEIRWLRDEERATRDGKVVCEFMYLCGSLALSRGNRKRDKEVVRTLNQILRK